MIPEIGRAAPLRQGYAGHAAATAPVGDVVVPASCEIAIRTRHQIGPTQVLAGTYIIGDPDDGIGQRTYLSVNV